MPENREVRTVWLYSRSGSQSLSVLTAQMRELLEEAERKGYIVAGTSQDQHNGNGVHRAGLKLMMGVVRSGHAHIVMVWELSRLSRDNSTLIRILNFLQDHGAVLVTADTDLCYELSIRGVELPLRKRGEMYHGETAEGERGQGKSGCAGATVWAVFRQDMLCRTKFRYGTKSVGRDYAGVPTSHGKGTEFTIRLLSVKFVWINDDRLAFARCERERGGSSAPTVLYIRHHDIGVFNEPAVSSGDSVAWWNIFQRRIQRIVVELKVYISGKISEDQRGFNVGKLGFQLMNNLGSHEACIFLSVLIFEFQLDLLKFVLLQHSLGNILLCNLGIIF